MAELRIGTCSWNYPSWHRLVYSAPKSISYLAEYAAQFNTVEIDRWFWSLFGKENIRLPNPEDARAYRKAVPDNFRFSIKAPNSVTLTHYYQESKEDPIVSNPSFLSASLFREFLARIDPIREVMGPILFQFEYLNKQKMASQNHFQDSFEKFAEKLPGGYTYGIEIRNPNYLNASYFTFLNHIQVIPVLLQGYWMPPVVQVITQWKHILIEQKTVVIRLHGPDRQKIEKMAGNKWHQVVIPRDRELDDIAGITEDLMERGVTIYLNVNNHFEGSAPLTIKRIKERLRGF